FLEAFDCAFGVQRVDAAFARHEVRLLFLVPAVLNRRQAPGQQHGRQRTNEESDSGGGSCIRKVTVTLPLSLRGTRWFIHFRNSPHLKAQSSTENREHDRVDSK